MSPNAPPPAPATRTVRCPGCGGPSLYTPGNAYRPFCGERCKNIDLGAWATEGFSIPVDDRLDDAPEDPVRLQ